jgi:ribose-phosphate pyrophosphokinase
LGVFANFINSLAFDRIYTFDVHSNVSLQVMPQLLNLDPIEHYNEVGEVIDDIGQKDLLLIFPDFGAAKRYDPTKISKDIHWTSATKVRDAATGKLSGFEITSSVKFYKKALIVDDICDGGGTFLGLGEEIRKINPSIRLYLYVSHGIFSQGLDKLDKMFDNIYISEMSFLGEHHKGFKKTGE